MSVSDKNPEFELIPCPICDGQDFNHLFHKEKEPFVRCAQCHFTLINPRPSFDQIAKTYDPVYSRNYTKKAEKKRKRALRRVKRLKSRYRLLGNWLDVGCSAGFLIEAAQNQGFSGYGIDIEAGGLTYGKETLGLSNLIEGTLGEYQYPSQFFDVISAYDVIEHVTDLNLFLTEIKRILKPRGIVDIGTPDIGHWRVPKNLPTWNEFKPSEHLYYFNKKTLEKLLDKNNLKIVKQRFSLKPSLKVTISHAI
jgi:2-polyprenyl-3-methyl-5-hydroxy-6-metoxy-1,4-benzoquinol methylase